MLSRWNQWFKGSTQVLPSKGGKPGQTPVYARPWLLGVLLSLWLAAFLSPHFTKTERLYIEGEYVNKAIKATRDFSWVDQSTTFLKREEAEAAVLPVYDFDMNLVNEGTTAVSKNFSAMREFYQQFEVKPEVEAGEAEEESPGLLPDASAKEEESTAGEGEETAIVVPEIPQQLEAEKLNAFGQDSGVELAGEELDLLADRRFNEDLENIVRSTIKEVMGQMVVADMELLLNSMPDGKNKGFVRRIIQNQKEETLTDLGRVRVFQTIKEEVPGIVEKKVSDKDRGLVRALSELVVVHVKPNLFFNGNETSARKTQARNEVAPVTRTIEKGQLIIADGNKVTVETEKILAEMYRTQLSSKPILDYLGIALLAFGMMMALFIFMRGNISKFMLENKDILFLFVMVGMTITLTWIMRAVSEATTLRFERIPLDALQYAIPIAASAMMVRFILFSEVAFGYAIVVSVLMGMLFDKSLAMVFYVLVSSVMGAHWMAHTSRRQDLMLAGIKVGLVNMGLVIAITLIFGKPGSYNSVNIFALLSGAFAGGLLSGLFVLALAPLVEIVFSYTTDIKLLELANMNHPLLKEMVIHAPGTYNHSILVATLSENAAEAVNANPLLAKVGGLYQDIGKIGKPHYFIENQRGIVNPHDKLYPRMSSLILLAHVKEGVDLGRKHRLGDRVTDIIQQHHGTGLIKYFYNRAKEMDDPKMESCSEEDFRYPGPKPQTREAGIVMLADIVEATSRTLKDPTPSRINKLVETSIDNVFKEGQLDECELTLRDLNAIAQAFVKVLNGLFHSRIEYPEQQKNAEKKKVVTGTLQKPAKDGQDTSSPDQKTGDDDTKVVKIH